MASKSKRWAYHHKLFVLLVLFSWTLVGCCLIFQYRRETHYKAELLNCRLQLFNQQLADALTKGDTPEQFLTEKNRLPLPDLRISIIDRSGNVAFDNSLDSLPASNHLSRSEIAEALRTGRGYTVRRHSSLKDETYFYSALAEDNVVIRTAVPYSSVSLSELLAADRGFLRFMLGVTSALSILAYFATRRLGHHITRLNRFAEKAERGERIYADEAFPDDELGEISSHIIRLYARMQNAIAERDRQHELALHEEQEKIRIKKQLTNNINHELKTPVAAIQVCLETLMEHPDMTTERRTDFIRKCHDNSERLCSLLNDVATLTRMDDGSQLIEKRPIDLCHTIRKAVDETPENGFRFMLSLPDAAMLQGNAALLYSVFRNLIDNAIAYSGGNCITIRVTTEAGNKYNIHFSDNGTGVEERHLSHLFERFYRIDKGRSRRLGGTGLGLSIVKNAVWLHEGNIRVANQAEGGLVFKFTLART